MLFKVRVTHASALSFSFVFVLCIIMPAMEDTTTDKMLNANPVEIHLQQVNEISSVFCVRCDYIYLYLVFCERLGKNQILFDLFVFFVVLEY